MKEPKGKKRQFDPMVFDGEKDKNLRIFEQISNKKAKLDVTKAVGQQINAEERSASAQKFQKGKGGKKGKGGGGKKGGKGKGKGGGGKKSGGKKSGGKKSCCNHASILKMKKCTALLRDKNLYLKSKSPGGKATLGEALRTIQMRVILSKICEFCYIRPRWKLKLILCLKSVCLSAYRKCESGLGPRENDGKLDPDPIPGTIKCRGLIILRLT